MAEKTSGTKRRRASSKSEKQLESVEPDKLKAPVLEKAKDPELKEMETVEAKLKADRVIGTIDTVGSAIDLRGPIRIPRETETQLENSLVEKYKKAAENAQANEKKAKQDLEDLQKKYDELKEIAGSNTNSLQDQVLKLQNDKEELDRQLKLQNERLSASFSAQELAGYLNEAISEFNNKMSQASDSVSYTIGNMEVNLKAQLVTRNDKLSFLTRSESGEAAMSDIRISIAATPRE